MKKITVVSPANIAFIKFWGKKDPKLNIPFNDSFSMNLDSCLTTTTVEFDGKLKKDVITVNEKKVEGPGRDRVVIILDVVRKMAKIKTNARVDSKNSFPSDAGIASSASGFSALALAASGAAGLNLSEKDLSILARLGSGSACRSIPDGFTYWKKGADNKSSYSYKIEGPEYWGIRDIVAVVSKEKKKSGSTEGHAGATSGPYFKERIKMLPQRIKKLMKAFKEKDFEAFGILVEEEAIDLHVMAMTSKPAVYYWNGGTVDIIKKILELREKGIKCYFTMDAGSNVHVICLGKDEKVVEKELRKLKSCLFAISNKPAVGAKIIKWN